MSEQAENTGAPDFWAVEEADNVATCIHEGGVSAGEERSVSIGGHPGPSVKATQDIPYGHKVALAHIGKGERVIKYAMSLGFATADIEVGEHVHVHNIESERGRGDAASFRGDLTPHEGPWAKWKAAKEGA